METETIINLAASFMSGSGFYINLGIQTAGYAWAAWGMKICRIFGDDDALDGFSAALHS
jgi:hypothetical protein